MKPLSPKFFGRVLLVAMLASALVACGDGGGGDGDGDPLGWIAIDEPGAIPETTDMNTIVLQGTAFVTSSWPGIDEMNPGVTVAWENAATGRTGQAEQWVQVSYRVETAGGEVPEAIDHFWQATVPLAEGDNPITLTATDLAGNRGKQALTIGRLTKAPPRVTATLPADQVSRLPVDTPIRATFNKPMEGLTINAATFIVKDDRDLPVSGTVAYDQAAQLAVFTPSPGTDLAPATGFRATLDARVQDLAGNPMGSDYAWSFATGGNAWLPTATIGAPSGRSGHTAVWTGSEMLVWGGRDGSTSLQTGGRYTPVQDIWQWQPMSDVLAPSPRSGHVAFWTGMEMLVWGGDEGVGSGTGGRYNPVTDRWQTMSTLGAPTGRQGFSAVWTGEKMIIWGGEDPVTGTLLKSGSSYDPATDSWQSISLANAPRGRTGHTAVWTGSEMLVWGGFDGLSWPTTVAGYNPANDTWRLLAATGAPAGRRGHAAVWTGTDMVIWGGLGGTPGNPALNSGGRYAPGTGRWTTTATLGAPYLSGFATVWTGEEMLVWGGVRDGLFVSDGGRYNPLANTWGRLPLSGAPSPRAGHAAVWSGAEMIVWGGNNADTGGRYVIGP